MYKRQVDLPHRSPVVTITPSYDCKKYVVAEQFWFHGTLIPKGYEFDGASVPRFFWRVVSPFQPYVIRAACGHDYLYSEGIGTKKDADIKFKKTLIIDGVPKYLAETMYRSVRMFGKGSFNERKG